MAQRKLYTEGQLDQYFDRVAFPKANRIFSVSSLSDEEKLEYLNLVQKHQLVKVPWENLTQHYSWHHVVHVDPVHLFKKIIAPGMPPFSSSFVASKVHPVMNSKIRVIFVPAH